MAVRPLHVLSLAILMSAGCDLFTALGGGAGLPCNDDSACPAQSICFRGRCTAATCARDSECPSGQVCRQSFCAAQASDASGRDGWISDSPRIDNGLADVQRDAANAYDAAIADAAASDGGADAARVDGAVPPLLVTITPRDGTTGVAVDAPVQLDFSRAMNTSSVESGGFCLQPVAGGCVVGTLVWAGAASAVFAPDQPLGGSQVYAVVVRGTCEDAQRHRLVGTGGADCSAPDQCTRFVTSDGVAPTVLAVQPANGVSGVALYPTITLTFSEPMEQVTVLNRVLADGISVSGIWEWISSTVETFTPASTLDCSQLTQVIVDDGARDPSGLALTDTCTAINGAAFCSSFTTKPTHRECHEENLTTCHDNLTLKEACCSNCIASMPYACDNVGVTYTVSCGVSCPTGCHYRRDYDTTTVCNDVCS